jgi:Na+-driven multidrug efflux pump
VVSETFLKKFDPGNSVRHIQRDRTLSRAMYDPKSADAPVVALFSNRWRWFTTVGLQGALAILFTFFPGTTMEWFQVPPSVELGIVYQLYGGLLMFRAVMEQYVRSAGEPMWMRNYMVASFPFNLCLAYFLGYAAYHGLMTMWIGALFSAMAVAELVEYIVALVRWSRALRSSGT